MSPVHFLRWFQKNRRRFVIVKTHIFSSEIVICAKQYFQSLTCRKQTVKIFNIGLTGHLSHSHVPSSSPRLLRCDIERVEGAGGTLTSSQHSYNVCAPAPNNHKIYTVFGIDLNDTCRRESATLWLKRKGTGVVGWKQSKKATKEGKNLEEYESDKLKSEVNGDERLKSLLRHD
ncbi:hypothetical protein JHK86_027392 [Glycine max]|nr:hypothetical protein JHK86_027392 [Glycine max]